MSFWNNFLCLQFHAVSFACHKTIKCSVRYYHTVESLIPKFIHSESNFKPFPVFCNKFRKQYLTVFDNIWCIILKVIISFQVTMTTNDDLYDKRRNSNWIKCINLTSTMKSWKSLLLVSLLHLIEKHKSIRFCINYIVNIV